MRVLYLIDSLAGGGAERSLAALAPAYADRDLRLTVAYLHERGVCRAIDVSQGAEMGRPSSIAAEIDDEGLARVSGSVVPIIDGEVELPE